MSSPPNNRDIVKRPRVSSRSTLPLVATHTRFDTAQNEMLTVAARLLNTTRGAILRTAVQEFVKRNFPNEFERIGRKALKDAAEIAARKRRRR